MIKQQAVELLLHAMNGQQTGDGIFGWTGGSTSTISIMQRDINVALTLWRETGNTTGLKQITGSLHVMGSVNDIEYEQIMEALDGEK